MARTHSKDGIRLWIIRKAHSLLEIESVTCTSFIWARYHVHPGIVFLHCQSLSQGIILGCKQARSTTISVINSRKIFTYLPVSSVVHHGFPLPLRNWLCFECNKWTLWEMNGYWPGLRPFSNSCLVFLWFSFVLEDAAMFIRCKKWSLQKNKRLTCFAILQQLLFDFLRVDFLCVGSYRYIYIYWVP